MSWLINAVLLLLAEASLDALALLKEDCANDDHEQVIHSINRLATVGLAIGPARTRTELLQFLTGK